MPPWRIRWEVSVRGRLGKGGGGGRERERKEKTRRRNVKRKDGMNKSVA